MKIREYLQDKYRVAVPTTMTKIEAIAFGIKYPLKKHWLATHGEKEISNVVLESLKKSLQKRLTKQERRQVRNAKYTASAVKLVDREHWKYKKQIAAATSDDFLKSYEWRVIRMKALKTHGARCQCCGATPDDGVKMNVDHIKPRKIYPELALDINNLQVLCEECNHGKSNWDMTDWRHIREIAQEA